MTTLTGKVLSTKMASTVTVQVTSSWTHRLYHKTITRSHKYLAHTDLKLQVGDQVMIKSVRPLSRRKHWQVQEKLT